MATDIKTPAALGVPKYVNPDNREQVYRRGRYPSWFPTRKDGTVDEKKLADPRYQLTEAERQKYGA